MNKLFFVFFVFCTLFFSSCTREKYLNSALTIKSVYSNINTRSFLSDENKVESDTVLWCHGNDIEWYNATTGELKLKKAPPPESLCSYVTQSYFISLSIFLNDIQILNFPYVSPLSSMGLHIPCIETEITSQYKWVGCQCGNKEESHVWGPNCQSIYVNNKDAGAIHYYIAKGYPRWIIYEERENNWKAIETEWNIFINQLKREGKYRE